MIYKHKPEQSIGIAPIQTWLAKSLCVGDTIDRAFLKSSGKFDRKLRRKSIAKTVKLKVSGVESNREVSYFYLTDGNLTYKFKILENKLNAFLVDFSEVTAGDQFNWS
jgi:hypothetical protein